MVNMELGIITWIIFCVLVGWFASTKGRSGVGLFFVSVLLSPLVGFIVVLIMDPKEEVTLEKKIYEEKSLQKRKIETGVEKICPVCAESIKQAAIKCRFCGNEEFLPEPEPKLKPSCSVCGEREFYSDRDGYCNTCKKYCDPK